MARMSSFAWLAIALCLIATRWFTKGGFMCPTGTKAQWPTMGKEPMVETVEKHMEREIRAREKEPGQATTKTCTPPTVWG